jgi:hypothetical protein
MTTGRSVTIDDLKKSLKSRMNQYEMLNNTLLEMFERNSPIDVINDVRNAMNETNDDIKNLQRLIEEKTQDERHKKEAEEKKAERSLYDSIKKPTLKRSVKTEDTCAKKVSMYDNIKKNNSDDEFAKKEEAVYAHYDTPYNHLHYEKEYEKNAKELNFLNSVTDHNDEFCKNIARQHLFLTRFNGLNIKEWMVKEVNYVCTSQISVTIQDHLVNNRPIIADIRELFKREYNNKFGITIEHLDKTGHMLYSERLHECEITDIYRSRLDYTESDFSTITMLITFKEVTYETAH